MTSESQNILAPVATLTVLAAFMGGIIALKGPLESLRPQDEAVPLQPEHESAYVRARLWEDPLYAIRNQPKRIESRPSAIQPAETSNEACLRLLQLFVIMPSGVYAEDRENRRRQRHAVVSALTERDYVPTQAEQIRTFSVPKILDTPVAFEWYKPGLEVGDQDQQDQWTWILVAWLNSEDFDFGSLGTIPKLMAYLRKMPFCHNSEQVTVLLGPNSSGDIAQMQVQEPQNDDDSLRSLHILSPRATVPLDWIRPDWKRKHLVHWKHVVDCKYNLNPRDLSGDLNEFGRLELGVKSFGSVVSRDDQTLKLVFGELYKRGLFRGGLPLIAIVSEQDSAYGRLLDDVLKTIIPDFLSKEYRTEDMNEIVHEYGYLSGVDGELPPRHSQPTSGSKNSGDNKSDSELRFGTSLLSSAHSEQSFGRSQVDYIRRLADRIAQDMNSQQEKKTGNGLVVIGILGSDVYDKLLILRALRERLREATFFTTDLDARLTDPEFYAWTRNLIIGSPFGLTVKDLKGPSFRGSYQTALYRAVTLAVGQQYNKEAAHPRLFEIARTGAIDITELDGDNSDKKSYKEVHGTLLYFRSKWMSRHPIFSVLVVLLPLLVLTLYAHLRGIAMHRKGLKLRRTAHRRTKWVGVVSVCILALLMCRYKTSGPEPWPFFLGVSSVPTIFLHFVICLFAFGVICIACGRIAQAHKDLNNDLSLPHALEDQEKWKFGDWFKAFLPDKWRELPRNWCELWCNWRKAPWIWVWRQDLSDVSQKNVEVACFWRKYLRHSCWPARLLRISLPFVITFVVSICLVHSGSSGPLLTRHLYNLLDVTRSVALFFVVFTVFFCSDTLSVGHAVLRGLSCSDSIRWPMNPKGSDEISRIELKMDLLVSYTECVRTIAVLPFMLVFLLILAHSSVFEGWIWTGEIVVVYAGLSLYVLVQAIRFQLKAAWAKDALLSSLDKQRLQYWNEPKKLSRIEITRDSINARNEGAFVPWTRQPIIQSLLLPAVGYGIMILLTTLF